MNKIALLVLGTLFFFNTSFGQRTRVLNMPPQGLTDHQLFPLEKRLVIRLSDTSGTGIPIDLFRSITEQNPNVQLRQLYYITTGQKGNTGYGLYCPTLRLRGGKMTMTIKETKPKSGHFYSELITYPGLWVRTPKTWKVNSFQILWQ